MKTCISLRERSPDDFTPVVDILRHADDPPRVPKGVRFPFSSRKASIRPLSSLKETPASCPLSLTAFTSLRLCVKEAQNLPPQTW